MDQERETTPEVKPQIANLADLLKWTQQGRLRCPMFQPFRWDRARVRELFDSILKQYPIGTLLIWKSQTVRPSRPALGPLKLPNSPGDDMLVIDGQQRVSAIAGVLLKGRMEASEDIEDPGMWDLWFDAEGKDGQVFRHITGSPPPSSILVRDLLHMGKLLQEGKRLSTQLPREEEDRAGRIMEVWQAAATALTSYRLPYVEFLTDDLDIAVDSFTRLNRRGMDITADEMFSALSESDGSGPRLAEHIDGILREVRDAGYGPLDRPAVLRLILVELDLDPFGTDWSQLGRKSLNKARKNLDDAVARSRKGLLTGLRYLQTDVGLPSLRLLPYSGILVGIACYLGGREGPYAEKERECLREWVWHATFAGFADGNPSRSTEVWRALQKAGRDTEYTQPLPKVSPRAAVTPYPSRHDLRAARVVASQWADLVSWKMEEQELRQVGRHLNVGGADCFIRIFRPRSTTTDPELKELLSSPANRVFDWWSMDNPDISRRELAIRRLIDLSGEGEGSTRWLTRLHIDEKGLELLRAVNSKEGSARESLEKSFLLHRQTLLIAAEHDHLRRYNLSPPAGVAPPALDRQEEYSVPPDDL